MQSVVCFIEISLNLPEPLPDYIYTGVSKARGVKVPSLTSYIVTALIKSRIS